MSAPAPWNPSAPRCPSTPASASAPPTTGPYNLVLATHHRTPSDLYHMQTDTLGPLDDIQHTEITPTVRIIKRHGIHRHGHLLRP